MDPSPPSFLSLPPEIRSHTLSFLPIRDLFRSQRVSRAFLAGSMRAMVAISQQLSSANAEYRQACMLRLSVPTRLMIWERFHGRGPLNHRISEFFADESPNPRPLSGDFGIISAISSLVLFVILLLLLVIPFIEYYNNLFLAVFDDVHALLCIFVFTCAGIPRE